MILDNKPTLNALNEVAAKMTELETTVNGIEIQNNANSEGVTTVNDWDLAVATGWFQDSSTSSLNRPVEGGSRRFIGQVFKHSGSYIIQRISDFTGVYTETYERKMRNGTWLAWTKNLNSETTIVDANGFIKSA